MTWAPTETQKTIFDTLSNDATLQALLNTTISAPKIFDHVPDLSPYPYMTLAIKPTNDRSNEDFEDGVEIKYQINVWNQGVDQGDLKVQLIQKRVDELLNRKDIIINGWNIISHFRVMIDIIDEPDGRTKHGVQIFKLLLGGI